MFPTHARSQLAVSSELDKACVRLHAKSDEIRYKRTSFVEIRPKNSHFGSSPLNWAVKVSLKDLAPCPKRSSFKNATQKDSILTVWINKAAIITMKKYRNFILILDFDQMITDKVLIESRHFYIKPHVFLLQFYRSGTLHTCYLSRLIDCFFV